LGKRGDDSLPHLDFSAKTGDAAVFPDAEEGIEIFGKFRVGAGAALTLNGPQIGDSQQDNDASAHQLQELPAIHC
jgi:hypothetical protein